MPRRVFILGLDSMPPAVLYQQPRRVGFETLAGIIEESRRYIMRSCHPPITVPAWMVMFTGKTPGELGVYGFRHRKPGEFKPYIVNSTFIRAKAIWDWVGEKGGRSILFGVPPTYPPRPIHGLMVTDFTTPGPEKPYTWPPWLKRELEQRFGPVIFDVVYRSEDKERVRRELLEMVEQHTAIIEYLATSKKWDLFIYVEIGVDRAHHAFWRYFDPNHPRYEEHPVYSSVIPEVYRRIDALVARLLEKLPRDTVLVVLSDHGIKAMKGAFVINQWLWEKGYLKLRTDPSTLKPGTDLEEDLVDWQGTLAWAWGGYYSRIYINLEGREPHGIVKKEEYEDIITQLKRDIASVRGPGGEVWRNYAYKPSELYPETRGDPPDLMVYLDDLNWRPAGTLGWDTLYLPHNDRGPDDAVHDWNGVLAIHDPEGTVSTGDAGTIRAEEVAKILMDIITS